MAAPSSAEAVLNKAVGILRINTRYNEGVRMMKERESEFRNAEECTLAGIALIPEARQYLDDHLEEYWQRSVTPPVTTYGRIIPEVVIGAGLHAAIYCAVRVARGFPKPVVLEADRVGGTFAMSRKPSFWLNSLNRPGLSGLPLENGALNVLPGAPIQPSMISFSDFQPNTDLGFVVRIMLAKYATVISKVEVTGVSVNALNYTIRRKSGYGFNAARVIDARGLGAPKNADLADGRTIMTFPQFMRSLDKPFPMRGIERVAVIGDGDAGKCAVEALLGIGPGGFMSTTALDYVKSIDWYATKVPRSYEGWRQPVTAGGARGRYQRLGSYLRPERNRLRILPQRGQVQRSFGGVLVNDRLYDKVIVCTGSNPLDPLGVLRDFEEFKGDSLAGNGTVIARRYERSQLYKVGPAAAIPFSSSEINARIFVPQENSIAIFRLAPRTTALAATLD